jgi:diguanylate cyclase (GGDEF)-like protein
MQFRFAIRLWREKSAFVAGPVLSRATKGEHVQDKNLLTSSWGIGLSREQTAFLRESLGKGHELVSHSLEDLTNMPNGAGVPPFLVWLSSDCCRDLAMTPADIACWNEAAPCVLLLEKNASPREIEAAYQHGFSEILHQPLTKERVTAVMRRAMEIHGLHHDMECMAREILLERELLERKNELLDFLVHFLTNSTASLDLSHLLQSAYLSLGKLLPVRSLHAVLWERKDREVPALFLHICAPITSKAHDVWRNMLLEQARNAVGADFSVSENNSLRLNGQPKPWATALPADGTLFFLPIICGNEHLGEILLLTQMERHLGKDQVRALDSAMRHFSLSVKNAMRFRLMQLYADYDGLTKVHSRRHFEVRIEEEMHRATRYGQSLSLMMLDIDHFKQVNDTFGHHAGDTVLRQVAAIIAGCIRNTDYCARYGGEEFAVLLSHTDKKKAVALAERIRKQIARHKFFVEEGSSLNLTVSLGVASIPANSEKNKEALIIEADTNLYAAKQRGRNRTCAASLQETGASGSRNAG